MNSTIIPGTLKDCIPYKFFLQEGQWLCRWLKIDDGNFTEPFFDETISRFMEERFNSSRVKCVSLPEILPEWSTQVETIEPTAFIFHVSRCGSTLLSQLLSLNDENIVLSEVPFFDTILRDKSPLWNNLDRNEMLRSAIRFYGAKRNPKQSRVFIKADSWHTLFYKELRSLYPTVPFILLYRHPVEVLRSQQKRRGMQSVPGIIEPELFGFNKDAIKMVSLDEYMVKVLEVYFQQFIEIAKRDPLAYPVNYNEGAMNIMNKTAGITSMPINAMYMDKMLKRSEYHAKYPDSVYNEVLPGTDLAVDCKNVIQLYKSLDAVRTAVPIHT